MAYLAASDSLAYLAAQLAILVLRASVSRELPLAAHRVILAPSASSISIQEATERLARMSKPVLCRGRAADGTLAIECTHVSEAEPHEQQWYQRKREQAAKRGSYLWYLDEHYGASNAHTVLASGRDRESLLLPSPAVKVWFRDYEIRGDVWTIGDDVTNPLATHNPVYHEAKRRGAHGLLRFSSSADDKDSMTVRFRYDR